MKYTIHLLLLFSITLSCAAKKESQDHKAVKSELTTENVASNSQENTTKIQFQDFTVVIDGLEAFDENNVLKQVQKDTAIVYLELGESIEGKKISIQQSKFNAFDIYQRLENSITIADEGPHCDLTAWKHYNSEWKRIKNTDNTFTANTYTKEDKEKFILITNEELIEGVERYCEEKWVKFIKNNSTEYPSYYVAPSRMFLKIVPKNQNKEQIKIISFILPMGC